MSRDSSLFRGKDKKVAAEKRRAAEEGQEAESAANDGDGEEAAVADDADVPADVPLSFSGRIGV